MVPKQDRKEIFKYVREKIDHVLNFLKYKTKMFWIEGLSINPLSGVIGIHTEFSFLNPNHKVPKAIKNTISFSDNYMTDILSKSIKPVNDSMLEDYHNVILVNDIWSDYLLKANKAMYHSEYENFIIFCAISAESFIKGMTSFFNNDDVVLQKLIETGKRLLQLDFEMCQIIYERLDKAIIQMLKLFAEKH